MATKRKANGLFSKVPTYRVTRAPGRSNETTYKGYKIWASWPEGFKTSADPDSTFDTLKDVKAFINWQQRNPGKLGAAFKRLAAAGRKRLAKRNPSDEAAAGRKRAAQANPGVSKAQLKRCTALPKRFQVGGKIVRPGSEAHKRMSACSKRNPSDEAAAGRKRAARENPSVDGVEFTVRSDGSVGWSSDWIKLQNWASKKQHGFSSKSYGPSTYGHTEIFYLGKRNPSDEAAAVYEEFHGRPSAEIVTVKEQVHFHEHLATLGELRTLVVEARDGAKVTLSKFRKAILCTNEAKNQMFIRGGDQAVNLAAFGIRKPHEVETLGRVLELAYFTTKDHLGDEGGTAVYFHVTGETNENGRRKMAGWAPDLIYRTLDESLEFSGGSYSIRAEGVDK